MGDEFDKISNLVIKKQSGRKPFFFFTRVTHRYYCQKFCIFYFSLLRGKIAALNKCFLQPFLTLPLFVFSCSVVSRPDSSGTLKTTISLRSTPAIVHSSHSGPFYLLKENSKCEQMLTGATNMMLHYNLEHTFNKFIGTNLRIALFCLLMFCLFVLDKCSISAIHCGIADFILNELQSVSLCAQLANSW